MILLGSWTIRDIRPTPEGESQKIKIKVRVNIHGIVHISSACLLEKHQSNEPEAMQQEQEGVENMDQENSKSEPNGGSGCAGNEEVGLGDTAQEAGWAQRVTQWFSSVRYCDNSYHRTEYCRTSLSQFCKLLYLKVYNNICNKNCKYLCIYEYIYICLDICM